MGNKKIRILLTVPHLQKTASPFRQLWAISKYIPQDYFQLTICSFRANGFSETEPILNKLGHRVIVSQFRPKGTSLKHFKNAIKHQKFIASYGPFHLQHSFDFTTYPVESIFARLHSRIYSFTQRNLGEGGQQFGIRLKAFFSSKVVTISDGVTKYLKSLGVSSKKITKIPNGIDQCNSLYESIDTAIDYKFPYILYVGHIQRRKRHQDAIQTLINIKSIAPDLQLLIAGETYDYDYYRELRQLTSDLQVDNSVHFLGPRNDIMSLMKGASALLLCSESEGLPWVILEAMCMHLPVISSDIDGPKEIITNDQTGFLIPIGNIDGYVKALQQVIYDSKRAKIISDNAFKIVLEKYSASRMVAQYVNLWRGLKI